MSLATFVNSKKLKIAISADSYKEKLSADIAGLLMKPSNQTNEIIKNIIDIVTLEKVLTSFNYPFTNEFVLAIRTGNPTKVSFAHNLFNRWAKHHQQDSSLIEQMVYEYQSKLYKKELLPEDTDLIVKNSLSESFLVLDQIAKHIEQKLSEILGINVIITAKSPDNSLIVSEASVYVEGYLKFECEKTTNGFLIKNIEKEYESAKIQRIIDCLEDKSNKSKILTLYTFQPVKKEHFQHLKRDLSLGICAVLPCGFKLTDHANENSWKVKIDKKYIKEYFDENNNRIYSIIDEAPIKWLEPFKG